MTLTDYFPTVFNALLTGLGSSIGSFLGARLVIKRLEKFEAMLRNKTEEQK